jgi:hypothetical protein
VLPRTPVVSVSVTPRRLLLSSHSRRLGPVSRKMPHASFSRNPDPNHSPDPALRVLTAKRPLAIIIRKGADPRQDVERPRVQAIRHRTILPPEALARAGTTSRSLRFATDRLVASGRAGDHLMHCDLASACRPIAASPCPPASSSLSTRDSSLSGVSMVRNPAFPALPFSYGRTTLPSALRSSAT